MDIVNIIIAGVGGQGLVLTTDIISQAAFLEGYEVATNDVIGLAQRGGKVNGSIRFGKKVPTPNVPSKSASVLLGLEKLETLRFADQVMPGGTVLMNTKEIFPNPVIMEKAEYPVDIEEQIEASGVRLIPIDSEKEARVIGNIRVANTILIGALSTLVDISPESFRQAIEKKVPPKTVQANLDAFAFGREFMAEQAAAPDSIPEPAQTEEPDKAPRERYAQAPPQQQNEALEEERITESEKYSRADEFPAWICQVCGYMYDPGVGDPENGVPAGTAWEDLAEDWKCPLCGVGKDQFARA